MKDHIVKILCNLNEKTKKSMVMSCMSIRWRVSIVDVHIDHKRTLKFTIK